MRALFTTLGPNVHIFEKTPVMQIAGSETNPVVILLNGKKVRCRAAIVTTGPFLQELGLSDHRFCPIISYGALSRQLSAEEMEDFRGIEPWGVTAANSAGTTVRFTKDNRLATACFTALTIRVHLSRSDTRRNCCVRPLITASLIIRTLTSNTSGAA